MSEKKVFRNPTPTVDILIELEGGIVLIERSGTPKGWALPGGFVDEGETVEEAAIREAKEETSLTIELIEQFGVYSDPARDPRQHTMSTVFVARATGNPVGADDAKSAKVFALMSLPDKLCFDHQRILTDYQQYKKSGQRPRLLGRKS